MTGESSEMKDRSVAQLRVFLSSSSETSAQKLKRVLSVEQLMTAASSSSYYCNHRIQSASAEQAFEGKFHLRGMFPPPPG